MVGCSLLVVLLCLSVLFGCICNCLGVVFVVLFCLVFVWDFGCFLGCAYLVVCLLWIPLCCRFCCFVGLVAWILLLIAVIWYLLYCVLRFVC